MAVLHLKWAVLPERNSVFLVNPSIPVSSALHQVPAHLQLAPRTSDPGSSRACFHKIQCFYNIAGYYYFFLREDSHLVCFLIFKNFSFLTYTSHPINTISLWWPLFISQAYLGHIHISIEDGRTPPWVPTTWDVPVPGDQVPLVRRLMGWGGLISFLSCRVCYLRISSWILRSSSGILSPEDTSWWLCS